MKLLLDAGADVNAKAPSVWDEPRVMAMLIVVRFPDYASHKSALVKMLVDAGANVQYTRSHLRSEKRVQLADIMRVLGYTEERD